MVKRRLIAILTLPLLLLVSLFTNGIASTQVQAVETKTTQSNDVQVIKEGTVDTFMKNMPSATAFIGDGEIEKAFNSNRVILTCTDPKLVLDPSGQKVNNVDKAYLRYDCNLAAGTYDIPDYTITYKDVVELYDGTKADLVQKVTNQKIIVSKNETVTKVSLANSNKNISCSSFADTGLVSAPRDLDISVVKNGTAVDCTMIFSCNDIDVSGVKADELGTAATPSRAYSYDKSGNKTEGYIYDESIRITEGALSAIYVPTTSYLYFVGDKPYPTQADTDTYDSGYAVKVNGTFKVRWEGVWCGSNLLFNDEVISHKIEAETTGDYKAGGYITSTTNQTTPTTASTENENKTYTSMIVVPNDHTTECKIYTYTGYELNKVTVDSQTVDISTLKKNTDGSYSYVFNSDNSNADHKIEAQYMLNHTVTYTTDGNGKTSVPNEIVKDKGNPKGSDQTPNEGYTFEYWTADKNITLKDGTVITTGTTIETDKIPQVVVTEDITFTAHYKAIEHKVTYTTDGNGKTSVPDENVKDKGNPKGSDQTPNDGYTFEYWTADKDITLNDGTVIKSGEPITTEQIKKIVVTEDITLTAHYKAAATPASDTKIDNGNSSGSTPQSNSTTSANTGDMTSVAMPMVLIAAVGAGAIACIVKKDRKK